MGYNKVTLHGGQICDYFYASKNVIDGSLFEYVNSEPSEWGNNTLMLAKFNNDLVAGNSSITDSISGYEIRRQKGANQHSEYVATIGRGGNKYLIDYIPSNQTDYTYYLYPTTETGESGSVLRPFVTDEITTDWGYWSLLIVDETEEENVFYLNKMFKFELNLKTDDMTNNAQVSIVQNFTKYPTIQHGMSNYYSSALTALCGFISCDDIEYVQTPNMIEELKSLSSDTRRKFLKDLDGNIWEIDITAPINISTEYETIQRVKTVKVSWTEIGDASGVSIINNPNTSNVSWILTETGELKPYVEYIWDEQYIWDNSYRWTAQNDILETTTTNTGRTIYSEEGDV